jgi:DNA invertase Pin-like site-specific DNA recombinase
MKKCALYARVSTPEQYVETQLCDLRKFAELRGHEVVCKYVDIGISGTKARQLLKALRISWELVV